MNDGSTRCKVVNAPWARHARSLAVALSGGAMALASVRALAEPGPSGRPVERAAPARAPGQPLAGLTPAELERFGLGRAEFERARDIGAGLGPVYNEIACNRCHNKRGVGGAGLQTASLAGRAEGNAFDPLVSEGGPSLASQSVTTESAGEVARHVPHCKLPRGGESAPSRANVVVRRRTTPLFGLGLVDATPDAVFVELARRQPEAIRGRAAQVWSIAAGERKVGKFGWKAQAPSLHQFSGQALSLELGLTSPEFPAEQPPFGDTRWLVDCDAVADPEDDGAGVQRMADFMRLLSPIAPLEPSADARAGDALFDRIGCDGCHVRRLTSGPHPVAALSQQTYAPFSDFLLHDMGELGDGIAEADAGPREMRTAPLWGGHLSGATRLLHDGRARSLHDAIDRHDGQGAPARARFLALSERERQQLIAFLTIL